MRSFVTSSGRHVTPIAVTGPGRREGPSPYTKLHRVGGPDVAKVRSLTERSTAERDVQRYERASEMRTLSRYLAHAV
jgi:hypothetical protein